MIKEHKEYSAECDKCHIRTDLNFISDWLPTNKIDIEKKHEKLEKYHSIKEFIKKLMEYGWEIPPITVYRTIAYYENTKILCPRCNCPINIDIKKINGKKLLKYLSDVDGRDYTENFKYIFQSTEIYKKHSVFFALNFNLDDGDTIYKNNSINIYNDGNIVVNIAERFECSNYDSEIEDLTRKFILENYLKPKKG